VGQVINERRNTTHSSPYATPVGPKSPGGLVYIVKQSERTRQEEDIKESSNASSKRANDIMKLKRSQERTLERARQKAIKWPC
jgi:hypothetical protein